jgi:threonine dehydrogenase-like Zn-dependent dehydrogenase
MARKYGAIPLTQTDGSYTASLLEQTPYGPDVVLEVVGNPSAHALAIDLVRIGGVVASCGVHSAALTINGDTAYNKNLKFCFGRCHVRAMFPYALGLLQKIGKETPELLDDFVQKVVSIDEGPEVSLRGCRDSIRVGRGWSSIDLCQYYRLFNERKIGKVVFEFSDV